MTTLLSIDPGMSTGIVSGSYSNDKPFEVLAIWQVPDGLQGFDEWYHQWYYTLPRPGLTIISERFQPRPIGGRVYRSAELEPLRIEGYMMGRGIMPKNYDSDQWRSPQYQVLRKGADTAASKKLSDDLLRDGGLWSTGKTVGRPDANDANSAMKHALAYLMNIRHDPTIRAYWGDLSG